MRRKPRDKNNKESGQKRGEINQLSSATNSGRRWKRIQPTSLHQWSWTNAKDHHV